MNDSFTDLDVRRCPSCQAELGLTDVLCVACGFHLKKGIRLTTDHKPNEPATAAPAKRKGKRKRKYVWGFLHAGNALVLFSGTGFVLGILGGVVLSLLMGSASGLEYGINVFACMVVGTAIGGGTGYVLAAKLPNPSRSNVSEQLNAGLFRVVGGFMMFGLTIISFGAFDGIEAGQRGPSHLPRIAVALYLLLGKWGMLAAMLAITFSLLGFGIRAMIYGEPSDEE